MDLSGWMSPEQLKRTNITRKEAIDIYDMEPDRTDDQVKFIKDLMRQKGIKDIKSIYPNYKLKTNRKISIGMAKEMIDLLLKI